jgi:SAM-dependent methyltransferase
VTAARARIARSWKVKRRLAAILCTLAMAAAAGGCEQFPHASAAREPDVPYEPTPQHVVAEMLNLANVGPSDVVYDLGCGDGRIVIAAVKAFGARGVCVDIDPQRILESRANAEQAGVAQRIRFLTQDLFETDIGDATVVTLFLYPDVNLKLRPKLWRDLRPGTRVVSYVHDMGDWKAVETRTVQTSRSSRKIYLWTIQSPK